MKPFIPDGMKTNLRTISSSMFTSTATVSRHSVVNTDFGMSDAWSVVLTAPCWIRQSNNADLQPQSGGIYTLAVFRILFPWGTDVRIGDHIDVDGAVYLVQNTNTEDSNAINLVCMAQRLENS